MRELFTDFEERNIINPSVMPLIDDNGLYDAIFKFYSNGIDVNLTYNLQEINLSLGFDIVDVAFKEMDELYK